MRIARYDDGKYGVVAHDDTLMDISDLLATYDPIGPEDMLPDLITHFDALRDELQARANRGGGTPMSQAKLHSPLVRPSKIICMIGNYREGTDRPLQILDVFFKSPEAIVGDGDTVELPAQEVSIFHHEAEIAVVIGKQARNVSQDEAKDHIFGYTAFNDVSARTSGRQGVVTFLGKSFDTFAGFGPCITTADELTDPQNLTITVAVNGESRQDYSTSDMERPITELVSYLSSVATLNPGDVICCGTNHQGLGAMQHGDAVTTTVEGIGSFTLNVHDPMGRTWARGIDHDMAERVKAMAQNPAHADKEVTQ